MVNLFSNHTTIKLFVSIFLLLFSVLIDPGIAQTRFQKTYGGTGDDVAYRIRQTSDGGYLIMGYTTSFGSGGKDAYIIKTDANGIPQWSKTIGGTLDEEATDAIEDANGYVIGGSTFSYGAGGRDGFLARLDYNGNVTWLRTYGTSLADYYNLRFRKTFDGGFIVAYGYMNSISYYMYTLIKTDSVGIPEWTKSYGNSRTNVAGEVIQCPDSGYLTTGYTDEFGVGMHDFLITRTDKLGNIIWAKTIGTIGDDGGSYYVTLLNDSLAFITGDADNQLFGIQDPIYLKINYNNSNILWAREYGISGRMLRAISGTPTYDHGFATDILDRTPAASTRDMRILKTDSLGVIEWTKKYGGTAEDACHGIFETTDHGFALVGYTSSFGAGGQDIYFVKTDSQGQSGFGTPCNESTDNFGEAPYIYSVTNPAMPLDINSLSSNFTISSNAVFSDTSTNTCPCPVVAQSPIDSVCIDASPFILNSGTPAGGTYSGPGVSGGVFYPSFAGSGTHSIVYSFSSGGCIDSASSTITVNPLPLLSLILPVSQICINDTPITLNGGSPLGGSFNGPGVSAGIFDPAIAGIGTHSIIYSNTVNGCTNFATSTIAVNPLPQISLTIPVNQLCENTVPFSLIGGLPSGGTYSGQGISAGIFNPVAAGPGAHSIIYSLTVNGCTSNATSTITVYSLPLVSLTIPVNQLCMNASPLILTGESPPGGTFTGDGVNAGAFDPAVAGTGIHTITYSYSANGCLDSVSAPITVLPLPNVTLTLPVNQFCIDAPSLSLVGGTPAGGTYSGQGISGGTFDPSIAGIGTHTIEYSYTVNGCSDTVYTSITINPLPSVSLNLLANQLCSNAPPFLLNGGSPTGGTYSGVGIHNGLFDPTLAGVGTHSITYYYSSSGCSDSASADIVVSPVPVLSFVIPDSEICLNALPVTLNSGLPDGGIYSGTGVSGTIFDPSLVGVGTSTITYHYTNIEGCSNSITQSVEVIFPALSFPMTVSADSMVCDQNNIELHATFFSGAQYLWTGPDSFGSNLQNPVITNASISNSGTYTLVVTPPLGCKSNPYLAHVSVIKIPEHFILGSQFVCSDAELKLESSSPFLFQYQWNGPSNFTSAKNEISIYPVSELQSGIYSVTANSACGTFSDSIPVTIYPSLLSLWLPNCFTPNGDSKNDIFFVNTPQDFEMIIFNRWGEEFIKLTPSNCCWDGSYKSHEVEEGVYVYLLKGSNCKGESVQRTGTVTVLR